MCWQLVACSNESREKAIDTLADVGAQAYHCEKVQVRLSSRFREQYGSSHWKMGEIKSTANTNKLKQKKKTNVCF